MSERSHNAFMELLAQHQSQLFGYIFALVQNMADAEDLYQQTSIVLWQKFDAFEQGTDFVSWACQTAQFQVLNFLRTKRRSRVCFSDTLVENLAVSQRDRSDVTAARRSALRFCVDQLKAADRRLLELCYGGAESIKAVAESLGRSADGVYKSLNRIRSGLGECIRTRLAKEEH
ncbi:MAG: sigma-70 family RNA polymerase sigma factor [Pirellulales bacterium]|nr:sigma-70 family RNA polymerase sigma factor [Pirellulales bacterium]